MRDDGEPIKQAQVDRRAADARAMRTTLLWVALFAVVVLGNGIVAILGIEVLQAMGVWPTPEASSGAP